MKPIFLGMILIFFIIFSFRAFLPLKIKEVIRFKQVEQVKGPLFEEDLSKIFERAKIEKKTVAFYFSTSCHFCKKMKEEILNSKEFKESIKDDLIIFCVEQVKEEAFLRLQKEYKVKELPAFLLVTYDNQIVTQMGYLPIDGKGYGKKIKKAILDFKKLQSIHKEISSKELYQLYEIAKKLKSFDFIEKIFVLAVEKEEIHVLYEKYQRLMDEKNIQEALALRKKIESLDPRNIYKIHLKLALLDFRYLMEQNANPEETIAPLLSYVKEYGAKDRENHFRIEVMLVHFLKSVDLKKEALKHAREAYKFAPQLAKKELSMLISDLKKESES